MAKIVLFVDAMEPKEYGAGWVDTERGLIDSGHPKVTPKVTSEVYTGESPTVNGMGAAHSINEGESRRPRLPTIQEKLEAAGYNVASLYMPYCLPLQLQSQAWISEAMGQMDGGQNPLVQRCLQPPVTGDMTDPNEDWDTIFNANCEDLYAKSANMLNLIKAGDFDVVFIGIRTPDQYTHFQWGEGYREKLLEEIAAQVHRWEINHDVLWWSDHGSEEKKETFRVNKWLIEKGYLNVDVDVEFNEKFNKEMESRGQQGNAPNVENQIAIQSPGVTIKDGTQALSADPYDSCIDIMDDSLDAQDLISDLMDTGYYKSVKTAEDAWGEGPFLDESPDIVTLRADNVLVTGNIHPEPIGMGFYRTGVHSAYGAWGTTDGTLERSGNVTPQEFHDVIWEFVTGQSQMKQEIEAQVNDMKRKMEQTLSAD